MHRRFVRLIPGLVLCGAGLALMVLAELGLGPWEVFHQGLSQKTGLPIGTVGILVGIPVLLAWIPIRQRLGIGTVFNVVLVGLTIDAVLAVADPPTQLIARIGCLLSGVLLMGAGSGLYIGAGLGAGPRDGLMTGIALRTGASVRLVRTAIELTVFVAGWLLGGTVGVGTVVFALAIGPVVQVFLGRLTISEAEPTLTAPSE